MTKIVDLFDFTIVPGLPMPKVDPPGWSVVISTVTDTVEDLLLLYTEPTEWFEVRVHLVTVWDGAHVVVSGMTACLSGRSQSKVDVKDVRVWQPNWPDATDATQVAYAERLMDLLTWIPGPAGDGWRKMKEECERDQKGGDDMKPRSIVDVIDQIVTALATTEHDAFVAELKQFQRQIAYKAPELIQDCWRELGLRCKAEFGDASTPAGQAVSRIMKGDVPEVNNGR